MNEKLLIGKIYRGACKYVAGHVMAFAFLTVFYFVGSLLPIILSAVPFKIISLIYNYIFFFFATGCYYKQNILLDKDIFFKSSFRFLTAIVLFLFSIFVASIAINFILLGVTLLFGSAVSFTVTSFLNGSVGLIGKYLFIFMLFVIFFLIPSFAFVSEITGKNRSLLMTYAKTRGNIMRIALVSISLLVVLLLIMSLMTFLPIWAAALARSMVLVFVSICYFKMYDFFYLTHKRLKKENIKSVDNMGE